MHKSRVHIKGFFIFLLINGALAQWCYAVEIISLNSKSSQGIIQSADSIYVVTEPQSRTIMVEGKKSVNSHVPFSWLNMINPKNWFDHKATIDSYSRILTNVKIKLNTGSDIIIPKVLLRQTEFVKEDTTDEEYIKEYVIDGFPGKLYSDGRYKIKAKLTFLQNEILLSKFTLDKNDNENIFIGHIDVEILYGIKQDDGTYEFVKNESYKPFLQYGLLSIELNIDESVNIEKYSEKN
jgi:hypothetical protein